MGDRFVTDIEVPDLAANPAAPAAGFIEYYGVSGRPRARNSAGTVFDLGNILESARILGQDRLRVQIEAGTFTTTTDDFTLTFAKTYGAAPLVFVQPFATLTTQPTIAELISVNTTQAVVRTYRIRVQSVLLGGIINPTQLEGAFCHYFVIGYPV